MRNLLHERHKMNMLDMDTREKANKIHLDQMYRETKDRRLLRNPNEIRDPENSHPKRWQRFAIAFAAIVIFLISFVLVTNLS